MPRNVARLFGCYLRRSTAFISAKSPYLSGFRLGFFGDDNIFAMLAAK